MATISGVITAMVTPFDADGAVDLAASRHLARHLIENGSNGLVVSGTTGESPTLSDDEKLKLLETVLDEVGDEATIICGTGSNDTRHSAHLTGEACRVGAHAVLAVTPYYNKPNRAGLRAHFSTVADAAGATPMALYNIPSRVVVNMPPEFMAELASEIDNVVAVKQANDDELGPIEGLEVLAGNDGIFLRCLEVGGTGGILVSSHIVGPEMRALYDAATSGDLDRAREIHESLVPIYDATVVTSNPIPVKAALKMLGVVEDNMRLPMVPASEDERAAVRTALEQHGLLVAGGAS
jgi:4-hydroxy-tetrahydrodipicolinate synthase